ncbi:MAG: TraM recognition domain-containing protein [Campylobacterales bacterium]|nr:TraM recognition domain-containing protein [Campylobacterales bacterium]
MKKSKEELFDKKIKFKANGKVDNTVETNMNLEKGIFCGVGFSLTQSKGALIEPIIQSWSGLDSHKLTLGTTRQGKTRQMVADIEQQIAHGDNALVEEPKGSIKQEMIGYVVELAIKYKRTSDLLYVSPYFKELSEWFNPVYRYKNEQISSMVADIIKTKDEFYANIAKAIVLSSTLGLEFLEKFEQHTNPYDVIIMEKIEYSKAYTRSTNRINKYIWGDLFVEEEHGIELDVITALKKDKTQEEKKLIDEAWERTKKRYANEGIGEVTPLRTFVTLRDLAQFETIDVLAILHERVCAAYDVVKENIEYAYLRKLGSEAKNELYKISSRDSGFFSKVSTTYSTVMSDLITGDVGAVLNDSRINRLSDYLTSSHRGAIVIVQPFPMIYKKASEALGKILFYMINSLAGYVGASGTALSRRLYVNIDEAGSVLTDIVRELANKGGGLGFSLFLYTQSIADVEETLGPVGSRILLDNMNTKAIFKGNDPASLKIISEMLGTKKKAKSMGTSSDMRNTRVSVSTNDEDIASAGVLSQLDARKYILKHGSEIYLVSAPHVEDSRFNVVMPVGSLSDISREADNRIKEIEREMA